MIMAVRKLQFLFNVFRRICSIMLFDRISMRESFEGFYYNRLQNADPSIFDKGYFDAVAAALSATYEQERNTRRTEQISFVLLLLCVFGVLDKFIFNGLSLDIGKYSPFILLIYSATTLRLWTLKSTIATREAILTAHSRLLAPGEDADLYRLRFPMDFTPPYGSILDTNKPNKPASIVSTFRGPWTNRVTSLVIIFIFGYAILYLYLAAYALTVPGIPFVIRLASVLFALAMEFLSAILAVTLEFGKRRNPKLMEEYLAGITRILNGNKPNS